MRTEQRDTGAGTGTRPTWRADRPTPAVGAAAGRADHRSGDDGGDGGVPATRVACLKGSRGAGR